MQTSYLNIIGLAGIALFFFFLIVSFSGFLSAIRPSKIHSSITPASFSLDFEKITLKTSDGVELKGWLIPKQNSDKVIIALHGYPADKGDILPAISFLNEDFNILLFDFRYFGESRGSYTTIGAKEVNDLLAAVEFAKERGFQKIGVWGFSMGGAVALMTAQRTPNINAIVADSAYAALPLFLTEPYENLVFLKYPLAFFTRLWPKIFFGISIDEASPVKKVKGIKIPMLLIHSKEDEVVPFSHALLLKEALKDNPNAEFWFEGGVLHGQVQKEYQKRVNEFFQKNI
ncbi:alpha/beta fold hydrolase [Patescibacteria group bacterium]|nr:alpha/beta fold hydrolase [Patescibacteria group bacterium]